MSNAQIVNDPRAPKMRRYHAAKWDEPLVLQMGNPGERGIIMPEVEDEILSETGSLDSLIPASMKRKEKPGLPEVSQLPLVQHYMRLSQMTMGIEQGNSLGLGTCTMKYNPKIHEQFCGMPQVTELHPLQDTSTMQGTLRMLHELEGFMKEISGMDACSFQAAAGAQCIFTMAAMVRAYHQDRGEGHRDEIITTMFSHPVDGAAPATAGYKVITLMPEEDGLPGLEAMKAALSDRTAAIFITNPEDLGLYNKDIEKFTEAAHAAGAVCFTDQANANGILGVARARAAGFDACHFNIHKTFSGPHASAGPGGGALCVINELAPYFPKPIVAFDGSQYDLDYDRPHSVGKIRSFLGNVPNSLRAYTYIRSMGAEGLRAVADYSSLNHNYLEKLLLEIDGIDFPPYVTDQRTLEQGRYSFQKLKDETGIGCHDIFDRMQDFGIQAFFTSHHPYVVPEPFTPEACETYSKEDIEYWVGVMRIICDEARTDPQRVLNAPYNCASTKISNMSDLDDIEKCSMSWRSYKRKNGLK